MLKLLAKHFGSKARNRSRRPARRLFMESLERRELFSTDLLSAFALGNATDEMKPEQVATDNVGNRYVTGSFGALWILNLARRESTIRTCSPLTAAEMDLLLSTHPTIRCCG